LDKRSFHNILRSGLVAGDAIITGASVLLAYYLRFYVRFVPLKYAVPPVTDYLYAAPFVVLVFLLAFNYAGLYRMVIGRSRLDEATGVVTASSAAIILLVSATFFFRNVSYSRIVIMHLWVLSVFLLAAWRFFYRGMYLSLSKSEVIIPRIAIIGATEISKILIERLRRQASGSYRIAGVIDNKLKKGKKFCGEPVLGRLKDFASVAEMEKLDEVFIGLSSYDRREIADIILGNEKIKFTIASDILGIMTKSIDYGEIFGIPVFSVKDLPLNSSWNRFVKRAFDIVFSSAALTVLSPFFILIAILVKATSRGPVFYRQERLSRGNKPFMMLKFRTMKVDAEKQSGPVWAKENDPRRTPIGAFLRKTSIDELPQFINVLKGDISIIGPRPERPHFVEKFKDEIPRYIERHKVKGGLSGWAQVNGLRGDTSLEERIKYDLYYIENWNLWFDIKIVIKTVLEIFHHQTAY
jgi:exopolysaccharide biosynthesis polyprenyl glycosylphosphotransferase